MPTFIVDLVHPNTRPWSSSDGTRHFVEYVMDLKGADGVVTTNAKWSRKTDSPAPKAGDSVEGELTPDDRFGGFKFKKAAGGGFGGGGPRPEDPKRARSILRQHSQHMALLYVANQPQDKRPGSWAEFWELVDRFDADVEKAKEAA